MNLVEQLLLINHQNFILTNQRAMYWSDQSALIISDLHLGKTAHFRKNGIALPASIIQQDLNRLTLLISHFKAQKLIIVGDFLHAGKNSEISLFHEFKSQLLDLDIILIKGNHDRVSKKRIIDWGIYSVYDTYELGEILFSHEEVETTNKFVISGHLHPGVSLYNSNMKMKFPCYIVTGQQLILPAFSKFTGLNTRNHPKNSKYYFFSDEGIYEM